MQYPSLHNETISVIRENDTLIARGPNQELSSLVQNSSEGLTLKTPSNEGILYLRSLEHLFGNSPELREINVECKGQTKIVTREEFYQTPNLWHSPQFETLPVEKWHWNAERPHPIRQNLKTGTFYKRYVPANGKIISFRGIDPEKDLELFHEWHNQPRVSVFWELAESKEKLKDYMIKTQSDPHMVPVFVEFDGKAVGYFEMYWALEDRLGPYYPADAYDRGLHFLIGEREALGAVNTDTILKSALHFLFLDDPRTRRVMAEPRHDNKKVLKYVESTGWKKLKEFDFPHKRAALLECKRETFFKGDLL